jgi:hypothetical protein
MGQPAVRDPWVPRKDRTTYVVAALVALLELPVLAVIALAALVTRVFAAASGHASSDARDGAQNRPA